MKLVCPSCGATLSADACCSDADARQTMKVLSELPAGVARHVPGYLALFRRDRALRWATALRLTSELKDLTDSPWISWDKRPARPNSVRAWALALERIIENKPKQLPLKTHGYLRKVAYDIASEMDKAEEIRRIEAERTGAYTAGIQVERTRRDIHRSNNGEPTSPPEPRMTREEMRAIREESIQKHRERKEKEKNEDP